MVLAASQGQKQRIAKNILHGFRQGLEVFFSQTLPIPVFSCRSPWQNYTYMGIGEQLVTQPYFAGSRCGRGPEVPGEDRAPGRAEDRLELTRQLMDYINATAR